MLVRKLEQQDYKSEHFFSKFTKEHKKKQSNLIIISNNHQDFLFDSLVI